MDIKNITKEEAVNGIKSLFELLPSTKRKTVNHSMALVAIGKLLSISTKDST